MNPIREAFEARDLDAIVATLSPDVVIHPPTSSRVRFEGREEARRLFAIVLDLLGEVRYTNELVDGDLMVVVLEAELGGRRMHEAQVMRLDEEGRIREMTLFIRPLPGLARLAGVIGPRLARRRGRAASLAVAAFMRPLAGALAFGERTGYRLI